MSKYDLVDKLLLKKGEEREKERKKMLIKVFEALDSLSEVYNFKKAYIFGSLAKKYQYIKESDIDIAIEGEGLKKENFFPLMGELSSTLGVNIDLFYIEEVKFSDKIKKEGVLWKKQD